MTTPMNTLPVPASTSPQSFDADHLALNLGICSFDGYNGDPNDAERIATVLRESSRIAGIHYRAALAAGII